MPLLSRKSPNKTSSTQTDFRYFEKAGVPFLGAPPLMYGDEYVVNTVRVGISKFGMFDMSKPEQVHMGRTFCQVLDRAYTNEYEIMELTYYNNGVVTKADEPPAVFAFVVWIEKADTTPENAKRLSEQNSRGRHSSRNVG